MQAILVCVLRATVVHLLLFLSLSTSLAFADGARAASPRQLRVEKLIQQLGADRFSERRRAQNELHYLGHEAIDQLLEAQYSDSSEISLAAQNILAGLTVNWTREDEHPITHQILRNYGVKPLSARMAAAEWLSALEDGIGFAAVARIVRYDTSDLVSKSAALSLIENFDSSQPDQVAQLLSAIEPHHDSIRLAVDWLRTLNGDAVATSRSNQVAKWQALAQREWDLEPGVRTTKAISTSLTRRLAEVAMAGERPEVRDLAIEHMIEINHDNPKEVISIGAWLVDSGLGKNFETAIWKRFPDLKTENALFIYLAAEAMQRTDPKKADVLASQAFELTADKMAATMDPVAVAFAQINTAIALEDRGLTEWAVREYRRLLSNETDHWRIGLIREQAGIILSELLHDRGRDEEAADALAAIVSQETITLFDDEEEDSSGGVEARMHFFRAEHYRQVADREKQIEHLRLAIKADPNDADVLIAMHRLPRATREWQQQTRKYTQAAVATFESKLRRLRGAGEIANRAEIAKHLNQVAWLVSNTEGEQRKAVQQSRRSLELRPLSPGSLDTLGRCYFAVGKIEEALKYQRRAVKLEPHSQQIQRQLDEFEAAAKSMKARNDPEED